MRAARAHGNAASAAQPARPPTELKRSHISLRPSACRRGGFTIGRERSRWRRACRRNQPGRTCSGPRRGAIR